MNLKIVVVEDEFPVLLDITRKLESIGHQVVGAHSTYEQALVSVIENEPDFMILDINLEGDKTGIDLANTINKKYNIPFMFLSASNDLATFETASKANPMGFITKPFKLEDLRNNVELAFKNYSLQQTNKLNDVLKLEKESFFIKQNGVYMQLIIDEVTHIEAMDNYVKIFHKENRYTINASLKDVCSKLPSNKFIRIHKSFAVAINQINIIEGNTVFLKNGSMLTIGKTYKDELMASLKLL